MKRLLLTVMLTALAVMLIGGTVAAQPTGQRGGPGWHCPWMGGPGPGMRGGPGWYCPWGRGSAVTPPVAQPGKPLTADQAKAMVQQYISNNPNLKTGKVVAKDGFYEVDVITKDGSLVDRIQVNKETGWFRSPY